MTKKQLLAIIVFAVLCLVVATFFIVSLVLSQQHGNTLVVEWQTWFGIVKRTEDAIVETVNYVVLR